MKENKNETGEELLDIDEKGNTIEKNKEEKKNKSTDNFCSYILLIILFVLISVLIYLIFNKKLSTKTIFDKTTLKNFKLKNRLFFGAITNNVQKIETLSQNGVSLIVTLGASVGDYSHSAFEEDEAFRVDSDEFIEKLKKLPEAAHKHNTYILLDLVHLGLYSSEEPIYSPSSDNGFHNKDIKSKEMTKEDILRIQDYFVQGAIRAKKAGFDGIEIHGGHLTLVSLFLSQKFNRRTDEYGGTDEKRARFLVEIIKKIREAIGDEMIISAKIDSIDEEAGFTESGFITAGKCLEEAGADMIEVSGANPTQKGDMYFYNDTKKLAENLKIPVTCIGGIKTYEHADYILKNSKIEYVAMSRALKNEPDLIKKWQQKK